MRSYDVTPLPTAVVDGHCHLDATRAGDEPTPAGELLAAAAAVGVDRVVHIGCERAAWPRAVALAEAHPGVVVGLALHPEYVPALVESGEYAAALAELEALVTHPRVRVVGETGLDYHWVTDAAGRALQVEAFEWHIALAKRLGKPLQIHDRDAHDDVLATLARVGAPEATVLHCFSGDAEMARECVARGYHLSFGGTVTFKNAEATREALRVVPAAQLLVETDAPYLAPAPYRGKTNAPVLVPEIVRAMAQVRAEAVDELCATLSANAERLYGPWG